MNIPQFLMKDDITIESFIEVDRTGKITYSKPFKTKGFINTEVIYKTIGSAIVSAKREFIITNHEVKAGDKVNGNIVRTVTYEYDFSRTRIIRYISEVD